MSLAVYLTVAALLLVPSLIAVDRFLIWDNRYRRSYEPRPGDVGAVGCVLALSWIFVLPVVAFALVCHCLGQIPRLLRRR